MKGIGLNICTSFAICTIFARKEPVKLILEVYLDDDYDEVTDYAATNITGIREVLEAGVSDAAIQWQSMLYIMELHLSFLPLH